MLKVVIFGFRAQCLSVFQWLGDLKVIIRESKIFFI